MIRSLFNRYNKYRKTKYFESPLFHSQKNYAVVGVGMHSLSNFYPIIKHFGIRLKYVCTKSSSWKNNLQRMFPDTRFVNSIEELRNDTDLHGVLICATSKSHYQLLHSFLEAGKAVFIEKPPCYSLSELDDLIKLSGRRICKVGLQRRYWPGNRVISKKLKVPRNYVYQFHFGSYPAGDEVSELFIHALDYTTYLFGNLRLHSYSKQLEAGALHLQLHTEHSSGVTGLVDLSTQFSWNNPTDSLFVNCKDEAFTINYPLSISGEQKPKRFANMPAERILGQRIVVRKYFNASNLIVPAFDINTLILQGFYHELETFVSLVEGKNEIIPNDLISLRSVYEVMDQIRK